MKIYFFSHDSGVTTAGVKIGRKRMVCAVWEQAGQFYVITGSMISEDLQRHNFTAEQSAAFIDFRSSREYSREFWEGI